MERIRLELEILGSELEIGNLTCRRKPAIEPSMHQRNPAAGDVSIEEVAKPSASVLADTAGTATPYVASRGTFDRLLHRLRAAAQVLLPRSRSIDVDRPCVCPQETDDVTRSRGDHRGLM